MLKFFISYSHERERLIEKEVVAKKLKANEEEFKENVKKYISKRKKMEEKLNDSLSNLKWKNPFTKESIFLAEDFVL